MKRQISVAVGLLATGMLVTNATPPGQAEAAPQPQEAGEETRTAIVLPDGARAAVRKEMRQMLGALNGVLSAVARGDPVAAADAARSGGTAIAVDTDPAVAARLPIAFVRLGTATHRGFDALAAAVESGAPLDTATARLARLTANCVACHETYRLEAQTPDGP